MCKTGENKGTQMTLIKRRFSLEGHLRFLISENLRQIRVISVLFLGPRAIIDKVSIDGNP